ncbi:MAG: DUF4136 domain-containing protein [Aquabacterium sp.]
MKHTELFVQKWLGLLMACLVAAPLLVLGGCAGMTELTSQVSSQGNWPEGRQPGRYVFERLPSQQGQAELQDKLEAAAQPSLAAAGFEPVGDAQKADVSVQVASQIQIDRRSRYDPYWGPWGPWGRPGWGGWWGPGRGGVSMGMAMEPPYVLIQVDVLIRDRHSNQVLYETHATYDRLGAADDRLYPYLFEAALKDFPHQAVSPRVVTVPVQPDNR